MTKSVENLTAQLAHFQPGGDYLAQRNILITGASRGIGGALTTAVSAAGGRPIMLARNVRDMETIADQCLADGFVEPAIIPMNLENATHEDYQTVANSIEDTLGNLDGLVLNAGFLGELAPLSDYDPVSWARVFQINVHSQFLLIQALLPLLRRAADASIIFTSSGVGRKSRAFWGAYAASKFATEGMMETLADELSNSSVRANAVNPGKVRTRMRAQAYPAEDPQSLCRPEEIVPPYIFLLGPDSTEFNGQSLDLQT